MSNMVQIPEARFEELRRNEQELGNLYARDSWFRLRECPDGKTREVPEESGLYLVRMDDGDIRQAEFVLDEPDSNFFIQMPTGVFIHPVTRERFTNVTHWHYAPKPPFIRQEQRETVEA